jgi:hypothetical protein
MGGIVHRRVIGLNDEPPAVVARMGLKLGGGHVKRLCVRLLKIDVEIRLEPA